MVNTSPSAEIANARSTLSGEQSRVVSIPRRRILVTS